MHLHIINSIVNYCLISGASNHRIFPTQTLGFGPVYLSWPFLTDQSLLTNFPSKSSPDAFSSLLFNRTNFQYVASQLQKTRTTISLGMAWPKIRGKTPKSQGKWTKAQTCSLLNIFQNKTQGLKNSVNTFQALVLLWMQAVNVLNKPFHPGFDVD